MPPFDTLDAARAMAIGDVVNPERAEAEPDIRAYLVGRLVQIDGRWMFALSPTDAGVLWWEARS
ncbi:MAG TPA: hypothetical protein VNL16_11735 [Chloroflexota bacterium]|nr:hypothetical protein [Chloroflexota bacterium]